MSRGCRGWVALAPLAFAMLVPPGAAAAATPIDAGALAHCAAMTAADERLACYDSLAHPKTSPTAAGTAPPGGVKPSSQGPTAAPGTKTSAPAAAAVAAAPAGAAASGGTADPAKSFGLTKHPVPTDEGPDRIQAQARRVDTDHLGNVRVALDNGQVWTFNSPDALIRIGEPVTIKRGALGSYLLTTANHRTYKAQRSQ